MKELDKEKEKVTKGEKEKRQEVKTWVEKVARLEKEKKRELDELQEEGSDQTRRRTGRRNGRRKLRGRTRPSMVSK